MIYEVINHLGNVLVTISNRKISVDDGVYDVSCPSCPPPPPGMPSSCPPCVTYQVSSTPDGNLDYYVAEVISANDYYPFGLTMQGISSSAAGTLKNKFRFGGKELQSNEFSDNSGIEAYDFGARNLDPQIGRWWTGDPKADKLVQWSPYAYCLNNPIKFFDPNGEFPYPITIRSFHPAAGFGSGGFGLGQNFSGDNRGFSNVVSMDVTARVHHTVTADPEKGTLSYSKEKHQFKSKSSSDLWNGYRCAFWLCY